MQFSNHHSRKALRGVLFFAGMGITSAVLAHALQGQTWEARVVMPSAGYAERVRPLEPGQVARVTIDRRLPAGFERVHVAVDGEPFGFLAEADVDQALRIALRRAATLDGVIANVDAEDPARGLRIRLTLRP